MPNAEDCKSDSGPATSRCYRPEEGIRYRVEWWPEPEGFDPEEDDPIEDIPEREKLFGLKFSACKFAKSVANDSYWGVARVHKERRVTYRDQDGSFVRWESEDGFDEFE